MPRMPVVCSSRPAALAESGRKHKSYCSRAWEALAARQLCTGQQKNKGALRPRLQHGSVFGALGTSSSEGSSTGRAAIGFAVTSVRGRAGSSRLREGIVRTHPTFRLGQCRCDASCPCGDSEFFARPFSCQAETTFRSLLGLAAGMCRYI